jgi:hypothetical protein
VDFRIPTAWARLRFTFESRDRMRILLEACRLGLYRCAHRRSTTQWIVQWHLNVRDQSVPHWGLVALNFTDGWSNYNGLETAFTKRFSQRWQHRRPTRCRRSRTQPAGRACPRTSFRTSGVNIRSPSAISAIERSSMTMNGRERTDGRPDEIVPTAAGVVTC